MRPCLEDEELFALVDGALAEKDARVLRAHVEGCAACTKSVRSLEHGLSCLAEDEPLDVAAHADAIMAAIDRPRPAERPRAWRGRIMPIALGAIGAMAAAAALFIGVGIGHRSEEGFTARGAAVVDASIARGVGLTVQTLDGDTPRPLDPGAKVTPETRFVASHRNIGKETTYALVFGVDAEGAVHWLYPAYESAGTDPISVPLGPTEGRDVLMGTAVSFEDVSPGRLTIATLLSREPIPVSKIESRIEGRSAAEIEALRHDFPDADVSSFDVEVLPR